jgi:hypothetical protein
MDVASDVKPGRYVIEPSSTSIYAARMLAFGWQTPHNLTLSGTIRNKGVLAKKISMQMMVDSASVADALYDDDFLAGYGFNSENVQIQADFCTCIVLHWYHSWNTNVSTAVYFLSVCT